MRNIVRVIDSISDWSGRIVRWLCVVLILVMIYEVIMRYAFNSPTMWAYETAIMLGAAIYAFAFSYTHRHNAHIRVDIYYRLLSPRWRALIDVGGSLLCLLPLVIMILYASVARTWNAWLISEVMVETIWYPPAAPLRTVVTIGFCLFALQGVSNCTRDLYLLIRNKPL